MMSKSTEKPDPSCDTCANVYRVQVLIQTVEFLNSEKIANK